ncbi:MAG: hypothetical protein WD872_13655 [Pirellulaceae bacterium]
MKKSVLPKLKRFPAAKQRLLDQLLDKNSEGTISAPEKTKLKQLVTEAERLMVANGKLLAEFAESQRGALPANAIPLTVWVTPQPTGT